MCEIGNVNLCNFALIFTFLCSQQLFTTCLLRQQLSPESAQFARKAAFVFKAQASDIVCYACIDQASHLYCTSRLLRRFLH